MEREYDMKTLEQKLRGVSPSVHHLHALSEKDGAQTFHFWTTHKVTTNDMISICREMAKVIRRELPEKPNGWAAAIYPGNRPTTPMGVYNIGWKGRPDEWHLNEGQERKATDYSDWLAFRDRLQMAVATLGSEGRREQGGDFTIFDNESGPLEQTLFVNNPEFLTKELIAAIQKLLRDGPTDGVVNIFPSFGEAFRRLWEGIDVRVDSIEEKWDRQEAEQLLGDRLKI